MFWHMLVAVATETELVLGKQVRHVSYLINY